jgi:2-phospho-L-lactate transferase/gluconeogenesis factor (CofD/UPF0052 family)
MGELLRYPHVRLTTIVNAYDDGKSTGHIRRFFRMLGPSDIRKNQLVMMHRSNGQEAALKTFFQFRFPDRLAHDRAVQTIHALLCGETDDFGLQAALASFDARRRHRVLGYLSSFLENVALYERVLGEPFPFSDCALSNCIYAGAFEIHGRDFGLTVDHVGKLFNMRGETITNSNENRYLVAIRENGLIMNSEAEIVESRANVRIRDIYIVERPLSVEEKRNLDALPVEDKLKYLQRFSSLPHVNTRCVDAVREADIILYSPGTQHSSLYPTYMTGGLGALVRSNREAMKVFVANVGEDYETPAYSVSELVEGALRRLKNSDPEEHPASAYIHYVLANNVFRKTDHLKKYIRHDPSEVEQLGVKCLSGDFEQTQNWGKHDGERLVKTVLGLLDEFDQNRGDWQC